MESSNNHTLSIRIKRNCRTSCTTSKKGTSAVLLQSGLDEKWWSDSMECYCYLRNVQDLLADGKTPYERRFGESFKGPIVSFPNLRERQSENSSIRKEGITRNLSRKCLDRGGIWKGDILIADIEQLGVGRIRNICQKTECKRSPDIPERLRICIFFCRWFSKIIRMGLRIARTHSETGIHRKERESQRGISWR